ncbi:MAG: hypothetical protein FWE80_06685, partial [Oscillospiraceae bacterium]|nr:hypothetical protein [Oscillospiraceae bacterium]
ISLYGSQFYFSIFGNENNEYYNACIKYNYKSQKISDYGSSKTNFYIEITRFIRTKNSDFEFSATYRDDEIAQTCIRGNYANVHGGPVYLSELNVEPLPITAGFSASNNYVIWHVDRENNGEYRLDYFKIPNGNDSGRIPAVTFNEWDVKGEIYEDTIHYRGDGAINIYNIGNYQTVMYILPDSMDIDNCKNVEFIIHNDSYIVFCSQIGTAPVYAIDRKTNQLFEIVKSSDFDCKFINICKEKLYITSTGSVTEIDLKKHTRATMNIDEKIVQARCSIDEQFFIYVTCGTDESIILFK